VNKEGADVPLLKRQCCVILFLAGCTYIYMLNTFIHINTHLHICEEKLQFTITEDYPPPIARLASDVVVA
jgi:hypothetical protein